MKTLVLGIGNVLYGDEGAGVHVARYLADCGWLPDSISAVDGGTGSLALLETMHEAERIVFVDATVDGRPPGTLQRLRPQFASDFPPSLSAHDIGLRELVETWDLLGKRAEMVLYTISIGELGELSMDLGPAVAAAVPEAAARILTELV